MMFYNTSVEETCRSEGSIHDAGQPKQDINAQSGQYLQYVSDHAEQSMDGSLVQGGGS